ncbi:MAG: hypothetical protein ACRD29_16225 [Acidimicrobiales bacterium]
MTDRPDRPDRVDRPAASDAGLDELVSAYVDGVATTEETARVEADPALRARVAAFRAVAEAVGHAVAAPPTAARDAAIAQAVTAADGVLGPTPVAELAAARVRRERRRRGLWAASVAAGFILVAVGVPLVLSLRGGDDDTAAVSNDEVVDATGGDESGTDTGAEGDRPGIGAAGTTSTRETPASVGDETSDAFLGSFADSNGLFDEVRDAEARGRPGPQIGIDSASDLEERCPTRPDTDLIAVYAAELDGERVEVQVYDTGDQRVAVVLSVDCEELAERDL